MIAMFPDRLVIHRAAKSGDDCNGDAHACEQIEHSENLTCIRLRMETAVAKGRKRHDAEIKCVQIAKAFDGCVKHGP